MTNRLFQQHAMGYGASAAQVTCSIAGNVVYSGSVATANEPVPVLPQLALQCDNVAWSWTADAEFQGTQPVTIEVAPGTPLLLAATVANNPYVDPTLFTKFYTQDVGGIIYGDPFTDVSIDGIPRLRDTDPAYPGQWWVVIPGGSTFSGTLNVNAAQPNIVVFESVPETINPGASGTFSLSIPNTFTPQYPRVFEWRIINLTSSNDDFQQANGSVTFDTDASSLQITTIAYDPPQAAKMFQVEILRPAPNDSLSVSRSNIVTIS